MLISEIPSVRIYIGHLLIAVTWAMFPAPGVSIECFACIFRIPGLAEEEYNVEGWPMCSDYPRSSRTVTCDGVHFCRESRMVFPNVSGVVRHCGERADRRDDCAVIYNHTVCTCRGDRCNVHLLRPPPPAPDRRRRWWLLLTAPLALALLLTTAAAVRLRLLKLGSCSSSSGGGQPAGGARRAPETVLLNGEATPC